MARPIVGEWLQVMNRLPKGEKGRVALLLGVTGRTLLNWEGQVGREARPPGRPGHGPEHVRRALMLVRRELKRQGWTAGWRAIVQALGAVLPVRLIQQCVARWKAWRTRRIRKRRLRLRQRVEVHARDALWCLDATQVGRKDLDPILAEIPRDVGSHKTLCLQVGPHATGEEIIDLLECIRNERGGLPLVLVTDNGPAYTSEVLRAYLWRHQVIHLRSLPRTPQHNPWSEHGNSEIKQEAGISSDTPIDSLEATTVRLLAAIHRLDDQRLRPSLGTTNTERDRSLPRAYNRIDRGRFYATTRAAMRKAVGRQQGRRAQRRAEREAIYVSLESHGLVTRTRGDGRAMPIKGERIT